MLLLMVQGVGAESAYRDSVDAKWVAFAQLQIQAFGTASVIAFYLDSSFGKRYRADDYVHAQTLYIRVGNIVATK